MRVVVSAQECWGLNVKPPAGAQLRAESDGAFAKWVTATFFQHTHTHTHTQNSNNDEKKKKTPRHNRTEILEFFSLDVSHSIRFDRFAFFFVENSVRFLLAIFRPPDGVGVHLPVDDDGGAVQVGQLPAATTTRKVRVGFWIRFLSFGSVLRETTTTTTTTTINRNRQAATATAER